MKFDFLTRDKLHVSKTNMRYSKKAPDVADILPSVRKRGIIVPLLVRPEGEDGEHGIVAGARRFTAEALAFAEGVDHGPLPCAILEQGDDAAAIEASLIENTARLDPDEVTQWETFTRLVKEGQKPEDISATFGLPDGAVRRILALGNLLPRIRNLYRKDEIDAATVRHLTMASKSQQQDWLALVDDPEKRAPTGHQLKSWLFGGNAIRADLALFDVEASGLAVVADLFGGERYFPDPDKFWASQNAVISGRVADYLEAGWSDVVIVQPSEHFSQWEYEKTPKRKGGRVYIDLRSTGEVTFHEGYLSRKEAEKLAKGERGESVKVARPEVTSTLGTYIDLHRHAAVRAALTGHPGIALRLMVAHAIAGSHLWRVEPEPQTTRNEAVAESIGTCRGETMFDERRRAVLDLLGLDPERTSLLRKFGDGERLLPLFLRLLDLPDAAVLDCVTVVMGESLAAGSAAVDAVGSRIGVDMADWWQADDALFDLIRDKAVMEAMVGEVAGDLIQRANAGEKTKTLKLIVRNHLDGADGRTKVERWVPKWMAFPPSSYTERGGVGSVTAYARLLAAEEEYHQPPEPDRLAA